MVLGWGTIKRGPLLCILQMEGKDTMCAQDHSASVAPVFLKMAKEGAYSHFFLRDLGHVSQSDVVPNAHGLFCRHLLGTGRLLCKDFHDMRSI